MAYGFRSTIYAKAVYRIIHSSELIREFYISFFNS